jgi:putative nucleotidyltransferase with HDIG domain
MQKIAQEHFLDGLRELPTLPTVVAQVMTTLDQASSSARDLERLVANDQAIAARLLKLANSAFYGLPGKVTSLNRAITLLGFNTVRSMVLTIGVVNKFSKASGSELFDRGEFWDHSLSVAVVSKLIGTKEPTLNPEEAHIAGLLHDMGKMVFDLIKPAEFQEALKWTRDITIDPREAERTAIGFAHDEIGAVVAAKWRFPDFIRETMECHHDVEKARSFPGIVQCVALANEIVHHLKEQEKKGLDYTVENVNPELKARFLPTPRHEEVFITKYEVEVEKVRDILKLF